MTAAWKLTAEAALLKTETPSVLTTVMLQRIAGAHGTGPSTSTFHRWLRDLKASNKLVEVAKGVYLNRMGHKDVSPAAAASWIRARSIVSLSWVLEQAGITNNFGETFTCIIPTHPSWTHAQTAQRVVPGLGTFRFFTMRADLQEETAGKLADIRDMAFDYPRATPEKAFLDWLYLGQSHRSKLNPPPLDLAFDRLNQPRLKRLLYHAPQEITQAFADWLQQHQRYQADPDVQDNTGALVI